MRPELPDDWLLLPNGDTMRREEVDMLLTRKHAELNRVRAEEGWNTAAQEALRREIKLLGEILYNPAKRVTHGG